MWVKQNSQHSRWNWLTTCANCTRHVLGVERVRVGQREAMSVEVMANVELVLLGNHEENSFVSTMTNSSCVWSVQQ